MATDRFATKEDALLVLEEFGKNIPARHSGEYYIERLATYYLRQTAGCQAALRMAYREWMLASESFKGSHALGVISKLKLTEMEPDVLEYRQLVAQKDQNDWNLEVIDRVLEQLRFNNK